MVSPVAHHNKARMYSPGDLTFKKQKILKLSQNVVVIQEENQEEDDQSAAVINRVPGALTNQSFTSQS